MNFIIFIMLILVLFLCAAMLCVYKKVKKTSERLERLSLAYQDFEERAWHGTEVKCPICGDLLIDTSDETYRHYDSLETDLMMNPKGKYFKCKNSRCPEYGETKWREKIEEESHIRQANYVKGCVENE